MRQYLKADLWRIAHRKKKWFFWLLCVLIGFDFARSTAEVTSGNLSLLIKYYQNCLEYVTMFLGLFNLLHVYEDDLSVKTMQIVIGKGISRGKIITCKWLEMMILTLVDSVTVLGSVWLGTTVEGVWIKGGNITNMLAILVFVLLISALATALTMILIFHNMRLGVGLVLYEVLFFRPLTRLNTFLETIGSNFVKLHPGRVLPGNNIDNFCTGLKIGHFEFANFLLILIFIAIGFFFSYRIFKSKELDF